VLARKGDDIEQNPPAKPNGRKPDYRIEGEYFDHYAPNTSRPRNLASEIETKLVQKRQAERIVVSLDDTIVELNALKKQLSEWPIPDLKELLVIREGNIVWHWP
jgi:hypothetical protein